MSPRAVCPRVDRGNDIGRERRRGRYLFHDVFPGLRPYGGSTGAYDAFDAGIILQNFLQNAVGVCEKTSDGERFIVLTGKRKGRFFLMEVKNSFAGEVIFGQDGLPVTTKQGDASMHGIDLANVCAGKSYIYFPVKRL